MRGERAPSVALIHDGGASLAFDPMRQRASLVRSSGLARAGRAEAGRGFRALQSGLKSWVPLCRCEHRCRHSVIAERKMEPVTIALDSGDRPEAPAGSGLSASQRRAELRRRKLLLNSEQRINRIMGFHRPGSGAGENLPFPFGPALTPEASGSFLSFLRLPDFLTKPAL